MSRADHAIGLDWDGLRIRVESDQAADLEWLEEFLCPQLERTDDAGADYVVRLTNDDARHAELLAHRPAAADRAVDAFALDQQVIRLPAWPGSDGGRHLFDEKFGVVYVVRATGDRAEVVAPGHPPGPRIPAMRVIREVAMNHSFARGHVFIHGSAVAMEDAGIVVAGPTTSGKTTLLIHLLRLGNTAYVSNDRLRVREANPAPLLRGMPTITTLRATTLDFHPALRDRLLTSTYRHRRTIAESEREGVPATPWNDGRYGLSPAQFCRLLDVPSRATAAARVVLLPRKTNRPGHMTCTRLDPVEVERRLHDAIFGIGCWSHAENVFARPGEAAVVPVDELLRRCSAFAAQVPAFDVELGLQAYDDPAATRALLEGLLA